MSLVPILPPTTATDVSAPPAATLVRPGTKFQIANSTTATVYISVGKMVWKPWDFAIKEVSESNDIVEGMQRILPLVTAKWAGL